MIYTIGYQSLTPDKLFSTLESLGARLIDCRTYPNRAKPGFTRAQLEASLGDGYGWAGNVLGGFGRVTREGLARLDKYHHSDDEHVVLMCMEEAPGDCHRHIDVCGPHFPDALHIYQDMLITAGELTRAIEEDDDPAPIGTVA